jgi:hypothetical protein
MHINKKIKAAKKNAPRGFAPAAVAPPNTIAPKQVIREYRNAQGWVKGGDRHCPLLYIRGSMLHNCLKKRYSLSELPGIL